MLDPETGEVAAFEELVGSHGGMGGAQTEAFLLYPAAFAEPAEPIVGRPGRLPGARRLAGGAGPAGHARGRGDMRRPPPRDVPWAPVRHPQWESPFRARRTVLASPRRTAPTPVGTFARTTPGTNAKLAGWVHRRRDYGKLIFIDLRDRHGITQVVVDAADAPEAHEQAPAGSAPSS